MAMATKISSKTASVGAQCEVSLAAGKRVALRMWSNEPPTDDKPSASRPYETVGYVISGRAELKLEGETITLAPGDSRLVPAETEHTYRILETFTAVEATAPPAS